MLPELGTLALILALCLAVLQAGTALAGSPAATGRRAAMVAGAARGQLVFLAAAFALLAQRFAVHDFSVLYVANNSNLDLPLPYRLSAVWGGHEGSLLLWALTLALWTAAVERGSRRLPEILRTRLLGVLGLVSVGFISFMVFTSNPFERVFDLPPGFRGQDLNPLLQDPGLIFHPPLLYLGYVGFAVAFAFAAASLLCGRLESGWLRWLRPWTLAAWAFLTLGIALGSYWAYYELGWGGWWFWDPVENASLMPWLVGTALLHSLYVAERRGELQSWTLLLAITAFSLSLLGTFLMRSGVISSIHAFASDPARGVYMLAFLAVVVGGSLTLFALRGRGLAGTPSSALLSRETAFLSQNALLVVATGTVLLGTLYPLLLDAFGLGKVSVGPPWFNTVLLPIFVPLLLLMGIGPFLRWNGNRAADLLRSLAGPVALGVAGAVAIPLLLGRWQPLTALGSGIGVWLIAATLRYLAQRWRATGAGAAALPRRSYGMVLAHLGIAVTVLGITLSEGYKSEQDLRLAPGETVELAGYRFLFEGTEEVAGPNYTTARGTLRVSGSGSGAPVLHPEKRLYHAREMPMTEAAIDYGFTRHLYVSLGEPLADGAWSVRIYHQPFVAWIWLGALAMALGAVLAASDRRYRAPAGAPAAAGRAPLYCEPSVDQAYTTSTRFPGV